MISNLPKGINLAICSVLQAPARAICYTFTFICYAIDSVSNYGRTAVIQLLVYPNFQTTRPLANIDETSIYTGRDACATGLKSNLSSRDACATGLKSDLSSRDACASIVVDIANKVARGSRRQHHHHHGPAANLESVHEFVCEGHCCCHCVGNVSRTWWFVKVEITGYAR